MFNLVVQRHPKASQIIFVNDPYDLPHSIKDSEHERQTGKLPFVGGTRNIFIKRNEKLPSPRHFNNMFKNPWKQNSSAAISKDRVQNPVTPTSRYYIYLL